MSPEAPSAPPSRAAAPLFLVGAERSGTTMLRLMLDHHSQVAWYGELEFLVDRLPEAGGLPDVAEYARAVALDRRFGVAGFSIDPALDYIGLMESFIAQVRRRFGKPIVGTTIHVHFERVLRIWPQARFVHLVRDGRDVARSCIAMGWAGNVWSGARGWITAEATWQRLCTIVPPERRCEARFEELVRDPATALAPICRFIGVDYEPAMLEYHRDTSYERPDAALAEQWRRKLSPADLALLETRIGDLLRERGYPPSGVAPAAVGSRRRLELALQDRWYRASFRRRRYGAALWLADLLSRRLPHEGWRGEVVSRLNAIDAQHLR